MDGSKWEYGMGQDSIIPVRFHPYSQVAGPPLPVKGSRTASLATQFGCHHTNEGGKPYGWVR
jgi:hypothetical protein